MNNAENIWLTAGEAASILGISKPTLVRWVRQGSGPRAFRMPSGYNRFRRDDFEEWMKSLETRPVSASAEGVDLNGNQPGADDAKRE